MCEFSVIVPYYNAEDTLAKCIESIICQENANFQLILINDGSSDNSYDIANKYAQHDSRIVLLNQSNKGQGAARNAALDIAVGEYIVFVDADDYLEPEVLHRIGKLVVDNQLDILRLYMQPIINGKIQKDGVKFVDNPGIIESGRDRLIRGRSSYALCTNIYRRCFLNEHNLRMLEGVRYEDMDFVVRATWYARRMMDENLIFYNYVFRDQSVSNCVSINMVEDYYKVANIVAEFVNREVDAIAYDAYFRNYLGFLFSHIVNLCVVNDFSLFRIFSKQEINVILRYLRSSKVKKYRVQSVFISLKQLGIYKVLYESISKSKC